MGASDSSDNAAREGTMLLAGFDDEEVDRLLGRALF